MQSNASSLPIIYNFLVIILLVNVLFPCFLVIFVSNLAGFLRCMHVLGTRFGSLVLKIGSLESEKVITGSPESEKIGSLQVHTGYRTFPLKKLNLVKLELCGFL